MAITASDKRIGERTPFNIAKEAALQKTRIGKNHAGGRGEAPAKLYGELIEELDDLCGPLEAKRLMEAQSHNGELR